MAERDRYLDYLRAIAMILVVFEHATLRIVPSFPAVLPFEMPLFFFVSGASLYLSYQDKAPPGRYLRRRLERILWPYALLAAICAGLFYLRELAAGHALSSEQLVSWLLLQPRETVPAYVSLYTWFIRVVLAVSVAHLALARLFASDRYRAPTAVLLALGVIGFTAVGKPIPDFYAVPIYQLPQYTVFYGAFAYLGYYYATGRLRLSLRLLTLIQTGSMILLVLLVRMGPLYSQIQSNKFPPNVAYGLLGISWIAIWLILQPIMIGLTDRLRPLALTLGFFGRHSYTVYLYHGFGLAAADYALSMLLGPDWLKAVGTVTLVVHYGGVLALTALAAASIDSLLMPAASGLLRSVRDRGRSLLAPDALAEGS